MGNGDREGKKAGMRCVTEQVTPAGIQGSFPLGPPRSCVEKGSPTPGLWTGTYPWPVRNRASQQEVSCSPSPTLLPEPAPLPPPPPPVSRKIVFHETGPWCQKFGDCWCRTGLRAIAPEGKDAGEIFL